MARAKSGMGGGKTQGHQGEVRTGTKITETNISDESDLGSDIQGRNKLHGNDHKNVRNERRTIPEE